MKVTAIETIRIEELPNLLWVQVHTDEGSLALGRRFSAWRRRKLISTH